MGSIPRSDEEPFFPRVRFSLFGGHSMKAADYSVIAHNLLMISQLSINPPMSHPRIYICDSWVNLVHYYML